MRFEEIQLLISQKDLPGEKAHAPYLKYRRIFEDAKKEQARSAAVGIHIFQKEQQLYFYLIERSTYDGQHSGQMAFPGGKHDPTDAHLEFTARRESEEELGIKQQHGTTAKQLILDLLDEQNIQNRDIQLPNNQLLEGHPCFILNDKIVWGATALMLNELRMMIM